MLDIRQFAEEYIRTKLCKDEDFKKDRYKDELALTAIIETGMDRAKREKSLLKWLNDYRVLRSFPREKSQEIASQIIEFADEPRQARLPKDSLIPEYARLRERIRQVAPRSPKTGKLREVTSLTSKALWCCYPYDVPIFDNYALRALQVISRLCHMATSQGNNSDDESKEYARFVDVWLQVYDEVKPVIDVASLDGYAYKVRVLDRLLWYLGQTNFDSSNANT